MLASCERGRALGHCHKGSCQAPVEQHAWTCAPAPLVWVLTVTSFACRARSEERPGRHCLFCSRLHTSRRFARASEQDTAQPERPWSSCRSWWSHTTPVAQPRGCSRACILVAGRILAHSGRRANALYEGCWKPTRSLACSAGRRSLSMRILAAGHTRWMRGVGDLTDPYCSARRLFLSMRILAAGRTRCTRACTCWARRSRGR